jgi:predicted sulfurtransferase
MPKSNDVHGSSDPLSYICSCPASTSLEGGLVLLFYRYFTQPPALPTSHHNLSSNSRELASYHTQLTEKYHLGAKIRVATEGFNITVGGTTSSIEAYISELIQHWSFDGLTLDSREERDRFFKPSPGCGCAFGGEAKVNVKEEITPLGVSGYVPQDWSVVKSLEPWEWHEMFLNENQAMEDERGERLLIDVRNHYGERRISSHSSIFLASDI